MRVERADESADKGWYAGPWNSGLPVSVGYANAGLDEPHVHSRVREIYLVARGTSALRVERETVELSAGDVIILEPGEATRSSRARPTTSTSWSTCLASRARLPAPKRPRCRGGASE